MRPPRTILILVLLALAVGAERFGYYGARSFMSMDIRQTTSSSYADIGKIFLLVTWASIAGLGSGGLLAYFIGPRITAAIAGAIAALGLIFLIAVPSSALLGWVIVGFGSGAFRFCPYAAAGLALATERDVNGTPFPSSRRFMAMAAFASGAYLMTNLGASLSSVLLNIVRAQGGRGLAYGISVVFALIGAAFIGSTELIVRGDDAPGFGVSGGGSNPADNDPYRGGAAAKPVDASPMATIGSTGLAGLAILAIGEAFLSVGTSVSGNPPYNSGTSIASITWIFSLNPAVVILTNIVLLIVFISNASSRSRMNPVFLFAGGLLVSGFGLLVDLGGQQVMSVFALAQVIIALGEIAFPIGLTYAALSIRGRGVSLAVAFFMATSSIIATTFQPAIQLSGTAGRSMLLVLGGLGAIVCGIVYLAKARRLHTYFREPQELELEQQRPV